MYANDRPGPGINETVAAMFPYTSPGSIAAISGVSMAPHRGHRPWNSLEPYFRPKATLASEQVRSYNLTGKQPMQRWAALLIQFISRFWPYLFGRLPSSLP
jgi:hypothetical protein